jgi:large conductance mechanosensitive channel
MKIIQEFQEFIARGNVIDLAVGVIIGGAFGKIVTSLVNDIIMPPIGYMMHGINFADLYVSLNGNNTVMMSTTVNGRPILVEKTLTYEAAKANADAVIGYGAFLNTLLEFFIVAVCVFMLVKGVNRIKRKFIDDPPPAPPTKTEELLGEIRDLLRKG